MRLLKIEKLLGLSRAAAKPQPKTAPEPLFSPRAPVSPPKLVTTIAGLRDLQNQLKEAVKAGNAVLSEKLHEEFQSAVEKYSVGKSAVQVLRELKGT